MAKLEKVLKFKIQGIEREVRNVDELREALKDLEEQLEGTDFGAEEFAELEREVASARGSLADFELGLEALSPQRQTEAFVKLGEAVVGAFAIGSVLEEFAGKTQAVAEIQAKAERALVAIQGARAISEGIIEGKIIARIVAQKIGIIQTRLQTAATRIATRTEKAHTAAKVAGTIAQRALNFAAKAFPLLALTAGISAVVDLFGLFAKKAKSVSAEQKLLNETADKVNEKRKEGAKALDEEIGKMKAVFAIAKSDKASKSERRAAIAKINEEYGRYIPNLLTEASSLNQITEAEKRATAAMASRIILAQKEERIAENIKAQIKLQRELNAGFEDFQDAQERSYGFEPVNIYALSVDELKEKLKELDEQETATINSLLNDTIETANAFEYIEDSAGNIIDTQITLSYAYERTEKNFSKLASSVAESFEFQRREIEDVLKNREAQLSLEEGIGEIIEESNKLMEQFGATTDDINADFQKRREESRNSLETILQLLKDQAAAEFELAKIRAGAEGDKFSRIDVLELEYKRELELLDQKFAEEKAKYGEQSRERQVLEETFATRRTAIEEQFALDRAALLKEIEDKEEAARKKRLKDEQDLRNRISDLDEKIFDESIRFLELEKDLNLEQQIEIIKKREEAQIKALENERARELSNEELTQAERLRLIELFEKKRANIEKEAARKREEAREADVERQKEANAEALEIFFGSVERIAASTAKALTAVVQSKIQSVNQQVAESEEAIARLEERSIESQTRINELETELKDARGERKEFLLDQLERERKKEKQIADEQREAELKREELQKRQIALQKQQQKIEAASIAINAVLAGIQASIAIAKAAQGGKFGFDNIAYAVAATAALIAGFSTVKSAFTLEEGGALPEGTAVDLYASTAKMAAGGELRGPSHRNGGIRGTGRFGNIEVEGGEYVTNTAAYRRNREAVETINKDKGRTRFRLVAMDAGGPIPVTAARFTQKFADGGALPNFEELNADEQGAAAEGIVTAIRDFSKENAAAIREISPEVSVVEIVEATKNYVEIVEGATLR